MDAMSLQQQPHLYQKAAPGKLPEADFDDDWAIPAIGGVDSDQESDTTQHGAVDVLRCAARAIRAGARSRPAGGLADDQPRGLGVQLIWAHLTRALELWRLSALACRVSLAQEHPGPAVKACPTVQVRRAGGPGEPGGRGAPTLQRPQGAQHLCSPGSLRRPACERCYHSSRCRPAQSTACSTLCGMHLQGSNLSRSGLRQSPVQPADSWPRCCRGGSRRHCPAPPG